MNSRNIKITFVMPGRSPLAPIGGYKVVYEYANRLCQRGYEVTIIYPLTRNYKLQPFHKKLKYIPRFIKWSILGVTGRKWFKLSKKVKEKIVLSLNWIHVPKSDYYIATEVHTSYYLSAYPINEKNKLYLIQDYEDWLSSKEYVNESYRLGLNNIVVSNWLKDKVEEAGATATVIKNGFDFDYFRLYKPITDRTPITITMLYHEDKRKGCYYGLESLKLIHDKYPDIRVCLFGVPNRPGNLPHWIKYYQNPNKEIHNKIYNETSIYIAPSIQEGWGLTVGEAMICGAAIVCTDTKGFKEMVRNNENGLICKTADIKSLSDKIEYLINNRDRLVELAIKGNESIQEFSWDNSIFKMEEILNNGFQKR